MFKLRVAHYLNQFFAGIGGEDKADTPPQLKKGPLGPGIALSNLLSQHGQAEVVATIYCGDNYMTQRADVAAKEIINVVRSLDPDVVVAGPAFASGRYGLACGLACSGIKEELDIPVVMGVHKDSPAVDIYRERIVMVSTEETARGMSDALATMARIAYKLGRGERLGPADVEGYIPTGRIVNEISDMTMAQRLVDMVLKKVAGQPYQTEWPLPKPDPVSPAPPVPPLRDAKIAVVSEAGVVPRGNPDKLPSGWATIWRKYSIKGVTDLTPDKWQSVHGGFDTTKLNEDPDRAVPVDALRELERDRLIGSLDDNIYITVGNIGYVSTMQQFGKEIAQELSAAGVQGVILTGT